MKDSEIKSYDDMRSKWILGIPEKERLAFLQGFADGDGFVSFSNREVAISSLSNRTFLRDLLRSFGIECRVKPVKVTTNRLKNVIQAARLPLFRHAKSRLKALRELSDYAIKRTSSGRQKPSKEAIEMAIRLGGQGLSIGKTVYRIWKVLGEAITDKAVKKIFRDESGKER